MFCGRASTGQVARQSFKASSTSVWITDEDLAIAFQGFVASRIRAGVRHGSSVPGPLEARRRLAKRRIMNPAAATVAGPGIDLDSTWGLGFPLKQWSWRWQAPSGPSQSARSERPDAPPLSPRMVKAQMRHGDPLPEASSCVTEPRRSKAPRLDDRISNPLPDALDIRLLAAESVNELLDLAGSETKPTTAIGASKRGSIVCQKLLDLGASNDDLFDFLCKSSTSSPKNAHIDRILKHMSRQPSLRVEQFAGRLDMLTQTLRQGIASAPAIKSILRHLPKICMRVYEEEFDIISLQTSTLLRLCEAIQSSSVLDFSDLDRHIINDVLRMLSQSQFCTEVEATATGIIKRCMEPFGHRIMTGAASFLVAWIRGWRDPLAVKSDHVTEWSSIPGLSGFLNDLSPRAVRRLVLQTTAELERQELNTWRKAVPRRLLYPWTVTVTECHAISMADPTNKQRALLEKLLASPFTLDRIVPYLQRCSHIETARFFLRHLARSDLNPLKSSPANIDYFLVEKTFEGLAKERKGDAVYFTILEALHHHRRPIGDIARQLLGLLRGLSRLKEHASTIQHLMNSSVSVSPDMLAAELSRISRSDAALAFAILRDQQMSSRGRALLACCEDLMVALVDNPGLHPDDLFTLVKRDRQLLSRSPPGTNALRGFSRYSPARVRLVNRMASGFAHAAHLNPRVAFRYVYGCYAFLKRTSSPLTANISRALTHAAITRPLLEGQWVSTMKLRFVLGVVRQLEGGKVADDLDEIVFGWRGAIVSTPEYRQRAQRMAREATDGG